MNWRELISSAYELRAPQPGLASKPAFHPPASAQDIADLESQLRATMPSSLRSLLLETNGVMDMLAIDGGEWFDSMWLLWPTGDIVLGWGEAAG